MSQASNECVPKFEHRYAIIVALCALLVSCREDSPKPFPWVEAGEKYQFQYQSGAPEGDNTSPASGAASNNVVELEIVPRKKDALTFQWRSITSDGIPGFSALELNNTKIQDDGLYVYASDTCSFDSFFGSGAYYLRVPARPKVGQEIIEPLCGGEVLATWTVVAVDQVLRTPAGEFSVFAMRDGGGQAMEYWDPLHGLIRADRLQSNGTIEFSMVLQSVLN